jgi:hypothetical protein
VSGATIAALWAHWKDRGRLRCPTRRRSDFDEVFHDDARIARCIAERYGSLTGAESAVFEARVRRVETRVARDRLARLEAGPVDARGRTVGRRLKSVQTI